MAAIVIEAAPDAEFLVFDLGQASRVGWAEKPGFDLRKQIDRKRMPH